MSIILVDLGNSALKWSTLDDPENTQTSIHESLGLLDEKVKKDWQALDISAAYGCTVGSDWLTHSTSSFFKKRGIPFRWFKAEDAFRSEFELENSYEHPSLLGADRWFAAVGAVSLHPNEALLVCHLGTASTVDSVVPIAEGKYRFLGGRIAPGPAMMRTGLAGGTSHLPRAVGKIADFPTNTIDAITTGIIDSQLGIIDRAVKKMAKIGENPRILLAGGAAGQIAEVVLKEFDRVDVRHNLVLQGLSVKIKSL